MRLKKVSSQLSYYLKRFDRLIRPRGTGIERLIYAVTYRCNSRCIMCNIWQENHSDYPEVTIDDLNLTFSNNPLFQNLTDIGLTGGEPFLREDLDQICLFFLNSFSNARISINTNGLMAEKIYRTTLSLVEEFSIGERNRVRISFSVDGIGEKHDFIRGTPNNFEKVLKIVERMQEQIPGIEYSFTFTILPENYNQIWDVYNLSKELKVGFSFSPVQVSGIFYQNKDMRFRYTPEMLKEVNKQIRDIQNDDFNYKNYYYSKMVEYQKNPRKYVSCYGGNNSFFLDPYGKIFPCILYDKSFGKIKELSIQEILNGDNAKQIRNEIQKMNCHCWGCESEVSFRRSWNVALWSIYHRLQKHKKV